MSKGGGGGSMQGGYGQPRVPINQSGMYSQAGRMNPIGRDYGLTQRSNMGGKGGMPSPYARPPMMQPPRMGGFQPMMQPPRFGGFQGSYTPSNPYFNNTGISGNRSLPQPMSELRRERPFENPMISFNQDTRMRSLPQPIQQIVSSPPPPRNNYTGDERFSLDQQLSMTRADDIVESMGERPRLSSEELRFNQIQSQDNLRNMKMLREQLRLDPNNVDIQKQMGIYKERPSFLNANSEPLLRGLGGSRQPPQQQTNAVFAGGPNFRQLNQPNNQTRALESALNSPSANQNRRIGTGVSASDVPSFDPSYNSGVAGNMGKYNGSYTDPDINRGGRPEFLFAGDKGQLANRKGDFGGQQQTVTPPPQQQTDAVFAGGGGGGMGGEEFRTGTTLNPYQSRSGGPRAKPGNFGGGFNQPIQSRFGQQSIPSRGNAKGGFSQPSMGGYPSQPFMGGMGSMGGKGGRMAPPAQSGLNRGRSGFGGKGGQPQQPQQPQVTSEDITKIIDARLRDFQPQAYDDSALREMIQNNQSAIGNISQYDDSGIRSLIDANTQAIGSQQPSGYDDSGIRELISGNQEAIANMPRYEAPDLSGFATTEDLNTRLSGIPAYDDSQLRQDINSRFETFSPNFDVPDFSNFVTSSDLDNRFSNFNPDVSMPDLSGFATTEDLNQRFSNIPTYDDSQLREDINSRFSNFNPSFDMPDLSGFATTEDINQRFSNFTPSAPDLSGFATTEDINQRFANMPSYEAPDLSGFATTEDINQRFSNIPTYDDSQLRQDINQRFSDFNPNVDLSNYATTGDLNSAISGLPSYEAPDLSNFVTQGDLSSGLNSIGGYDDTQLRQDINQRFSDFNPNVDLSNYATTGDLTSAISGLDIPTYTAPDLSGYATSGDLTRAISGLDIPTYTAPDLSGYATTGDLTRAISDLPSYEAPDLSGYATTGDLTRAISDIPQFDPSTIDMSNYATQSDLSNINTYDDTQLRQDINSRFSNIPQFDSSSLQSQIEANQQAIGNIPQFDASNLQSQIEANQQAIGGFTPTDLSNYATLDQLSEGIGGIQAPDLSGFATKEQLSGLRGNVLDNISRQGNRGQLDPSLYSDEGLGTRFSDNYANVGFMNQMAEQNAQVDSEGNSIFPTFSYDPKTNEYVRDSSAFGLTGDSAITRYSPEDFFAQYGRTLGKMPSANNNQNPQDAGTGNTDNPDLYDDSNIKGNNKSNPKEETVKAGIDYSSGETTIPAKKTTR